MPTFGSRPDNTSACNRCRKVPRPVHYRKEMFSALARNLDAPAAPAPASASRRGTGNRNQPGAVPTRRDASRESLRVEAAIVDLPLRSRPSRKERWRECCRRARRVPREQGRGARFLQRGRDQTKAKAATPMGCRDSPVSLAGEIMTPDVAPADAFALHQRHELQIAVLDEVPHEFCVCGNGKASRSARYFRTRAILNSRVHDMRELIAS
jgi:hypothetical protein